MANPSDQIKWYSVVATYKSVNPIKPRKRLLWERLTFLIRAENDEQAQEIAESTAKDKEHEYLAIAGNTVRWVFHAIEKIQELFDNELTDGSEVSWEFFERVDKPS